MQTYEGGSFFEGDQSKDFLYDEAAEAEAKRFLGHQQARYGFAFEPDPHLSPEVFILPLNPQSLTQDEEAAVTIVPTQGGVYVDNRGSIFKDITISGTTGFLPKANVKPMGGDTNILLSSDPKITTAQRERASAKVSGYAAFHTLRSMFRRYWDLKKSGNTQACLYFINTKDNEAWLVEPLTFSMPRTSKSPLGYQYQIKMRTLAKGLNNLVVVGFDVSKPPDPAEPGGLAAIEKVLSKAATALQDAANVLTTYMNKYTTSVMGFVDSILGVVNSAISGIKSITSGQSRTLGMPKDIINDVTLLIDDLFDVAKSLVIGLPTDFIDSLTTIKQQFDHIGAQPTIFSDQWKTRWESTNSRFNDTFGISKTASSSFSMVTVQRGSSVWAIASSSLGDPNKAYDIISLNNLKYPYIVDSADLRQPGTLAPGDTLLLPSRSSGKGVSSGSMDYSPPPPGESGTVYSASSSALDKASDTNPWRVDQWTGYMVRIVDGNGAGQTRQIVTNGAHSLTVSSAWAVTPDADSLFQIFYRGIVTTVPSSDSSAYGSDMMLAKDGDLAVSSSGDFQALSGLPNFAQAIDIKLRTERRGLILHPWFGLLMSIGERGSAASLFSARFSAERTIMSDSRVSFIKSMAVTFARDVYSLTAHIVPKGTSGSLPINKVL